MKSTVSVVMLDESLRCAVFVVAANPRASDCGYSGMPPATHSLGDGVYELVCECVLVTGRSLVGMVAVS